jgi:SAM-dependent methyltransferase
MINPKKKHTRVLGAPRKVILKYSKPSQFYVSTKKDFFNSNIELLKKSLNQNLLYVSQPNRDLCKICRTPLPKLTDLHQHNVEYVFCEFCSHLNGKYEDTQFFVENLYISESGKEYAINYIDDDYIQRINDIYLPKADFLIRNLPHKEHYEVLDIGCGSGYFVGAALIMNLEATGIDVSNTMVNYGNTQLSHHLNKSPLKHVNEDGFMKSIVNTNADIISAIGVIEHLRSPHDFFSAFKKSNAKFLYYSVPMFSFSVLLENVFTNVFPRQLSGGHTHLFTETSLNKMNELIGVESIAEWRFGTDIMDLYRSILINTKTNQSSQKTINFLHDNFGNILDTIQNILDKNHFCSEIHVLVAKK